MVTLLELVEQVVVKNDKNANQRQAVALVNHLIGDDGPYRAETWADEAGNEVLIIVKANNNGQYLPLGKKAVGKVKVNHATA